jgi:hypothetical protein
MDHRRHAGQGWSLLIVQVAIDAALVGLAAKLFGVSVAALSAGGAILGAVGAGTWALWRAGRYNWAWTFLLLPGLALAALVGLCLLFIWAYL